MSFRSTKPEKAKKTVHKTNDDGTTTAIEPEGGPGLAKALLENLPCLNPQR
jgi:hypothetical protein